MRKTLTALVTAGAIAIATVATPSTAHARWGWWGGAALGGLFAGALIASAFARPYYYGYGYPAYYGYGYGYPTYGYGYGYPAYYGYAYSSPRYYSYYPRRAYAYVRRPYHRRWVRY